MRRRVGRVGRVGRVVAGGRMRARVEQVHRRASPPTFREPEIDAELQISAAEIGAERRSSVAEIAEIAEMRSSASSAAGRVEGGCASEAWRVVQAERAARDGAVRRARARYGAERVVGGGVVHPEAISADEIGRLDQAEMRISAAEIGRLDQAEMRISADELAEMRISAAEVRISAAELGRLEQPEAALVDAVHVVEAVQVVARGAQPAAAVPVSEKAIGRAAAAAADAELGRIPELVGALQDIGPRSRAGRRDGRRGGRRDGRRLGGGGGRGGRDAENGALRARSLRLRRSAEIGEIRRHHGRSRESIEHRALVGRSDLASARGAPSVAHGRSWKVREGRGRSDLAPARGAPSVAHGMSWKVMEGRGRSDLAPARGAPSVARARRGPCAPRWLWRRPHS